MAHDSNINYSDNYYELIKEEHISDDKKELIHTDAALWLAQEAEQEEYFKRQMYKEELYADHVVKEELVISPEVLQQPHSIVNSETVEDRGTPCLEMVQFNMLDMGNGKEDKLNTVVIDHKTNRVASTQTESMGNDKDLKNNGYNSLILTNLSLNSVIDSHIAESLNSLKGLNSFKFNTSNYKLNQTLYFSCSKCDYLGMSSNALNKHARLHDTSRQFCCDSCGLRFVAKRHLLNHINCLHSDTKYLCDTCGYKSTSKRSLQSHLRVHIEKKVCASSYQYAYNDNSNIRQFITTHCHEKPYNCTYCKYSCSQISDLKLHLRTHPREKPYTCTHCNYRCSKRSSLKVHLRNHTGEKPYICTYCRFSCSRNSDLKVHIRRHTGEKPYTCTFCKYSFCQSGALKRHLKTHPQK